MIPFAPLWAHYRRVCKRNAAIVLTANFPFSATLTASNLNAFRYCWVWEKSKPVGHLRAKLQPMRAHEDVLVFGWDTPRYFPQGLVPIPPTLRKRTNTGGNYGKQAGMPSVQKETNYPRTVIRFPSEEGLHPTQKPVALMEYLIRTYTNEGELVLDNTAGSFTTGVAAFRTGRKFIGIERDPDYFKIGVCRLCDEARALSLCGTTDRDILSWKVDWPFQEIQNPYTALCDEKYFEIAKQRIESVK